MKNPIIKTAFANTLLTVLYITLVASILRNAERLFGQVPEPNVLIPILMLSLFVFSAAITGFLVFGRPMMWYLDGRKEDSLSLLAYTLVIFFVIIVILLLALLSTAR